MSIKSNELEKPKVCPFCGIQPIFFDADPETPAAIFCNNECCGVAPDVWATDDDDGMDVQKANAIANVGKVIVESAS